MSKNLLQSIEEAIRTIDNIQHLKVSDYNNDGHHISVLVVSDVFDGMSRIKRHRVIYDAIGDDVGTTIHALTIKALTNKEYQGD